MLQRTQQQSIDISNNKRKSEEKHYRLRLQKKHNNLLKIKNFLWLDQIIGNIGSDIHTGLVI
jgi:hypothetical protein